MIFYYYYYYLYVQEVVWATFYSSADTGASTIITIDSWLDSLLWIYFSLSEEPLEFQEEFQSFGDTASPYWKVKSIFFSAVLARSSPPLCVKQTPSIKLQAFGEQRVGAKA